jgi:hypothetical protein
VSPSKPIPLECKGEPKTTLRTTFANLFKFGEQEATHKSKFISISHVPTILPDKNKWKNYCWNIDLTRSSIVAMYKFVFTLQPLLEKTHMEEWTFFAKLIIGTKASSSWSSSFTR